MSWRYLSRPFPPAPLVNVRHGILTRMGRTLAAALAALLVAPAAAAAQARCSSPLTANGVPVKPGPALRMGITPAGEAGALGPAVALTPIDAAKTYAALDALRPPGGAPFVLRLNRLFWSDGEAGLDRFAAATTSPGASVVAGGKKSPG